MNTQQDNDIGHNELCFVNYLIDQMNRYPELIIEADEDQLNRIAELVKGIDIDDDAI